MALPLDDLTALTQRWRAHSNAPNTLAMCEALRVSPRAALVDEVGALAARDYPKDAAILTATARMFMAVARFADAQAVLVTAGRAAPRDARVYQCLGEVLLRRGDAERATKVFERARALGARSDETAAWSERAKRLVSVQQASGMHVVAQQIADATGGSVAPKALREPSYMDVDEDALEPGSYPDNEPTQAFPNRAAFLAAAGAVSSRVPPISSLPPLSSLSPVSGAPASFGRPHASLASNVATSALTNASSQAPPRATPAPMASPVRSIRSPRVSPSPFLSPGMPGFAPRGSDIMPDAETVLNALTHAGVFTGTEQGASAIPWDPAAKRARGRGPIVLGVTIALLIGGSFGIFHQVRARRVKDQEHAAAVLHDVEAMLDASDPKDLTAAETKLGEVFDLDSRSTEAASAWLRERALVGLLRGGADLTFEGAMTRAADVGVRDADVAFARVASFLFQGDIVGAAALLPKWDTAAANDPWYQLVTGVVLERAGDRRALERYQAATRLDPALVVAKVALARSEALEGEPQKATAAARELEAKLPGRAEPAALVALSYLRDPNHQGAEPPEAAATLAKGGDLPASLAVVPFAVTATRAVSSGDFAATNDAIGKGLAVSDSPGVASWLGAIALSANNEELARRAALVAVSFSAVYPPARMLAARVALLGGRLEEALKATEELDASSPEVAVVRAAVAYERLDADALSRAWEGLAPDARKHPLLAALASAPAILAGHGLLTADKLLALARSSAPWSDLLAMDAALDAGDLVTATTLGASWGEAEGRPLRAARLARLARYHVLTALAPTPSTGSSAASTTTSAGPNALLDLADARSQAALGAASVTPRALVERVLTVAMRGRGASDGAVVLAKYPLVLGPQTVWLGAYLSATAGKVEEARARTASVDPPPPLAPLVTRTLAAQALAAMKDRRRGVEVIKSLLDSGIRSLDLTNAASSLGFRFTGTPGRRGVWVAP